MISLSPETKGNISPRLALADLREALFNGEARSKTDLDVLEEMAKDKRGLVKKVLQNKALIKRAGNPDQLLHELDALHGRYHEEIKTIDASKGFDKKIEKKGWGTWALEKAKSVVLFPVRHPVITALVTLTALGAGYYYAGSWEALMAQVGLGKVHESVAAALKMAKPTVVTPAEAGGGLLKVVPPAASGAGPYTPPILKPF